MALQRAKTNGTGGKSRRMKRAEAKKSADKQRRQEDKNRANDEETASADRRSANR